MAMADVATGRWIESSNWSVRTKLTVIMKNMMSCRTRSRSGVRFGSAPSLPTLAAMK